MSKVNGSATSTYLYGTKSILAFLSAEYGYGITRYSLWRLSSRDADPFPLRQQLDGRHQRVVANVSRVQAWASRNIVA